MTAFDTVTATISPAMSTYIRCKGKVWKNAFISSLQRIAGVEYSVYKKKGSWQIRGEWDNIKQAHKILMKVTATEDWLSFSVPETVSTKTKASSAAGSNRADQRGVEGSEKRQSKKTEPSPNGNTSSPTRARRGLRQKSETPVYNEEKLALACEEATESEPEGEPENGETYSAENDKDMDKIKQEFDGEDVKDEPGSGGDIETMNDEDRLASELKDEVGEESAEGDQVAQQLLPKSEGDASVVEPTVNRRKRGKPRKVQTSISYAENADDDEKESPPKGKKASSQQDSQQDDDFDESQMEDLMDVGDSENENDGEETDTSDKDFTIDSMIKEGKDTIKSLKKFFSCNTCEFKCKSRTSLDEHKQRLHGNRTFKCPICDKVYGVRRDLKKHIRRHTSQFKCEICNKTYKEQRNYRQHLKTHDDDYIPPQFACEQCEKSFTTKYVLQAHVDQIHNGNVPEWLCNVCGKKFKQKHSLQEHHLIHTGERPFTCKICCKSFRHKGSLVNHELLHTDIRLYTCEVCGKDFKHRNSLRIHAVVHSKFRNFECPVCSKRFTQKQALNRHSRIHSGEKPFMCDLCGDRFNDNSILRRHMMGIHKTELKSGKQHFVLPAEHYTQKDDQEEANKEPDLLEESELQQRELKANKVENNSPPEQGPSGLQSALALPDYRPGNETPPSLRAYGAPTAPVFQGYHPDPLSTQAPGPFPHVSMSSAAMAAALGTAPMANMGPFAGHIDNSSGNDHPISLTTSNNQYSNLQHNEQNKGSVLPSMQYHRMY